MDEKNRKIFLLTAVHYNNQAEVCDFVRHVNELMLPDGYEMHIAVTDNSGNWDVEFELPKNVSMFQPKQNLGYLNGCSFALRNWIDEAQESPEWVGLVNTDIELSEDFFPKLLSQSFAKEVAVIAPDIILPSGKRQNPHLLQRMSKSRLKLYCWIFGNKVTGCLYILANALMEGKRSIEKRVWEGKSPITIYAPHGSAVFLRRSYFDSGGHLESDGFMYGEELHVAEQALRYGLKVVWTPGITLRHNQHSSTGGLSMFQRIRWMQQSYESILENYYDKN